MSTQQITTGAPSTGGWHFWWGTRCTQQQQCLGPQLPLCSSVTPHSQSSHPCHVRTVYKGEGFSRNGKMFWTVWGLTKMHLYFIHVSDIHVKPEHLCHQPQKRGMWHSHSNMSQITYYIKNSMIGTNPVCLVMITLIYPDSNLKELHCEQG